MANVLWLLLISVISYFIGGINPAVIIGRISGVYIMHEGSGNAGTTNVIRVLGLRQGIITLMIDVIKGFLPVLFAGMIMGKAGALAAFTGVIVGHCYPLIMVFRGGKGVATTLGAAFALSWQCALIAVGVAVLLLLCTRIMSIASLCGVIAFTVSVFYYLQGYGWFTCIVAAFIIFNHRENVKRLLLGEEKPIQFSRKKDGEDEHPDDKQNLHGNDYQ